MTTQNANTPVPVPFNRLSESSKVDQKMRILLIEDNPGDADLVAKALASTAHDCTLESHVRLSDALERPDLSGFDVILSDLSLPDSDGLNCVRQLTQNVPDLPVIVLTSLANDSIAVKAIEEGAQDYLVKDSIDGEGLERSMRYAIQRQRALVEHERLLGQLRDSKELLEKKNQHLKRVCDTAQEFVDNVSHEFRTPLTVIMEYASLLRDGIPGAVNEDQQRLLDVIDDRACDLNTMVDDMLDVSRLESGLLGAWRQSCRVDEIVAHVLPPLRRKAEVRNVALEADVRDDLPEVYCDAEKARRVLVNLVVNAIKFSRAPGVVRVWAECVDSSVRISVSDNGPGIPADRLAEIFQRFSQIQTELRQSTKGFGLGLNIAQELVDLNLGQMGVESSPGQGSTFTFTLPIADPISVTDKFLTRLAGCAETSRGVSLVRIESPGDEVANRDIDAFLNGLLRQNDLVLRLHAAEWVILLATPEIEMSNFRERFEQELRDVNRNRPKGPLPELAFRFVRSWDVIDEADRIVDFVASCFSSEEICHA